MGAEKEVILIAGGRNKGGDFDALVPVFRQHVKHVVLIGESAPDLAAVAEEAGVEYQFARDMEDAVAKAFAAASRGDTVLLAPACASFDMFRSYGQRGEEFGRYVRNMAEETYIS
jgi:UDP-N-acetylmuramoylalanine--D-glutamate ligase